MGSSVQCSHDAKLGASDIASISNSITIIPNNTLHWWLFKKYIIKSYNQQRSHLQSYHSCCAQISLYNRLNYVFNVVLYIINQQQPYYAYINLIVLYSFHQYVTSLFSYSTRAPVGVHAIPCPPQFCQYLQKCAGWVVSDYQDSSGFWRALTYPVTIVMTCSAFAMSKLHLFREKNVDIL